MFSFNGAFKQSLHECKLIFSPCCVKRIEHFYCCAAFTQHCCRVFNGQLWFQEIPPTFEGLHADVVLLLTPSVVTVWIHWYHFHQSGSEPPSRLTSAHEHTDLKLAEEEQECSSHSSVHSLLLQTGSLKLLSHTIKLIQLTSN